MGVQRFQIPFAFLLATHLFTSSIGTFALSFDAQCSDGRKVGQISIDEFGMFVGDDETFGVTIKGGFDADPSCVLEPGAKFYWIQGYIGQPTFYSWEQTDVWSYDRTRSSADDKLIADGSPFYVNLRGPGYGHSTLGFFDEPKDTFAETDEISFLFQTALVCAIEGVGGQKGTIRMIDGFTWGFTWVGKDDPAFVPIDPEHSTSHFNDLFNAFYNDPDHATLKDKWVLEKTGCCCVPDAGTGTVLIAGVFLVVVKRKLRRCSRCLR